VIAIAEALIMRNELTDIDVKEILERVEAEHPYTPISAKKERPAFGFAGVARSNGGATLVRRRREAAPPPVLPAPGTIIIDAEQKREG
jgi:cell division protease FtsH